MTSYEKDREARAHLIQALQRKAALADQLADAVLASKQNVGKAMRALARKVKEV